MAWETVNTRDDGRRSYKKTRGNAWARVWDNTGVKTWTVYVGNGNNKVASGKSASLMLAKIAANAALKAVANGQ